MVGPLKSTPIKPAVKQPFRRAGSDPALAANSIRELHLERVFPKLADTATVRGKELKQLRDAAASDISQTERIFQQANIATATRTKTVADVTDQINGALRVIADKVDRRQAQTPSVYTFGALGGSQSLPIFTGAPGSDFLQWIRSFSDLADAATQNLTPVQKLKILLAYLKDDARDKAEELYNQNNAINFADMVQGLKDAFADPQRQEISRQALRACSQHSNESTDDFAIKIKRLVRGHSTLTRNEQSEKAREAFLDGLRYDLKFHVKAQAPNTFDEALSKALRYEALINERTRANTINPVFQVQMLQQMLPAQQEVSAFYPREQQLYNQNGSQGGTKQGQRPYQGGQNQHQPRRNIVCFGCGYEGHYSTQCPFREGARQLFQPASSQQVVQNNQQQQFRPAQPINLAFSHVQEQAPSQGFGQYE